MRSTGKALIVLLLVVVALVLVVGASLLLLADREPVVAGEKVLELDLTGEFPEHIPDDAFARSLFDSRPKLREVVEALDRAARDDSVAGLIARTGAAANGMATVQELRDGITAFRETGKPTVAYADTFGEFGPSNVSYYLATAFEQIFIQPSGDVGLSGLSYEVPFIAGTFDILGLEPRLDRRQEYKNAVNTFTETEFTPAHEEAMQALVDSQFGQLVAGIAEGRTLEPVDVRELFSRGPYFGSEALAAGLVDGLRYRDEVYEFLREELGDGVTYTDFDRYVKNGRRGLGGDATVAMIYGVGGVVRGESGYDPLGGMLMGADTVAEAFRAAIEDSAVDAILFRVDSPGGSYVASDTIWRETVRAREAGKPVVVSMGNLAASGGYFVSMAADRIVAQPGTITGSIGVYSGKILTGGLWSKLGVSWDAVESGPNAQMWSTLEDFDEHGWQRLQTSLDRVYDDFVTKVSEGRGLAETDVEQVARGRIWTGEAALERGLVDRLGGYPAALSEIRTLLALDDNATLRLQVFPRPKSTFELLVERFSQVGESGPEKLVRVALESGLRVGRLLRAIGMTTEPQGTLTTPGVEPLQ
jgi:protease-4